MDILLVVLRLIHIVSAFAWFGLGLVLTLYVLPSVTNAGESGQRFLKNMLTRSSITMAFPVASGLATLAGILLYIVGNSASHFTQTGNMVLGIGAVAGLLAAAHGGMATGRATDAYAEALKQYVPDDSQPVAPEGVAILQERAAKLATHSRISLLLVIIALLGMSSARYL